MKDCVEHRKGEYYVAGTRVPLECVVQEFPRGSPEEAIRESYPALTMEQVQGAIAYYLGNQAKMDEHFRLVESSV